MGKGGGLSGDSGRRFRVRWCARKLVLGPRGQGQVGLTACWVGTVGQGGGAEWGFGRKSEGPFGSLEACLGAERARAGGGDCVLGGDCWARGG